MDCKGGVVAAFMAMDALAQCGFSSRPVHLILQTDEETHSETSGRTTIRHICEGARNSVAHLNIESSRAGEPSAVLWRKGISTHSLTLQGKAAHASRCAFGISAVEAAARIVTALSGYKDHDGITFNCGLIAGGTAPNTVPDTCRLTVEYSFFTAEQRATAAQILREAITQAEAMGVSVTDEVTARDAMEKCERNFALLDKMNEIYAAEGLPTLAAKCSVGGSDAADATVAGIPCVDSIGVEGDRIHTLSEYARVSSLREAAYRIGAVIYCI
jgi:glutamate carboxypeptidase